jgi:hypothetical protein
MKSIYALILGGIVLSLFANCAKKDNATTGANEMSSACLTSSTYGGYSGCNNQVYASALGFGPAQGVISNQGAGYNGGYYGGGYGMTPQVQYQCGQINMGGYGSTYGQGAGVYSPTRGMGCVTTQMIQTNGQPALYALEQTSRYFVAQANYANYGYSGQSSTVYRTCDAAEPCPSNQFCRSPLGATPSTFGICYY